MDTVIRQDTQNDEPLKWWFALYTKPRNEFKAARQIESLGIEYYLPVVTKTRQWSDRIKKIDEPLIHGYIFIHATEKERLFALTQDSIVRCVAFEGKVATIPDWQINNLRAMLSNSSAEVFVSDQISAGTPVKIIAGPFEGVSGVVSESCNARTISVTIDLLKRSVTAYLPAESVVKIEDNQEEES